MKKTWLISLGAVAVAATSILAGCSSAGGGSTNVSAANLAKAVIENMPKEKGYTVNEGIDFQAAIYASGVNADMKMKMDMNGDVAQLPSVAYHFKDTMNVSAAGRSEDQDVERKEMEQGNYRYKLSQ